LFFNADQRNDPTFFKAQRAFEDVFTRAGNVIRGEHVTKELAALDMCDVQPFGCSTGLQYFDLHVSPIRLGQAPAFGQLVKLGLI